MNFSPQSQEISEPVVSIIVPARNEQDCVGDCIRSLQSQKGVHFEFLFVDDGSTDNTRQIATGLGVRIVDPDPLPEGWSGKSNAITSALKFAKGKWLLLTDADTIHEPGSLQAALSEAEEHDADMLSYSPHQIVTGIWQRALMPVVFSELASTYRPKDICDPAKPDAAANGQYILIRADVFHQVGGLAPVAATLLEDLALARLVKSRGYKLRFRMSSSVSTRMYRDTPSMWEGWTKSLAILFPRPVALIAQRVLEFTVLLASVIALAGFLIHGSTTAAAVSGLVFAFVFVLLFSRIRKAHFSVLNSVLAIMGLPVFLLLLVRSHIHYRVKRSVMWKGRSYQHAVEVKFSEPQAVAEAESAPAVGSKK